MKAISLFACGGIGDLGLRHAGFDVLVANELLSDRAEVFKHNFPETKMIVGDIWEKENEILDATSAALEGRELDLVFATPPCQGMSKNGRGKLLSLIRQGLKDSVDERNLLVIPAINIFKKSGAHTLIMENVPEMENTVIPHPNKERELINIIELIKEELGSDFSSSIRVVEFANYGVPQSRQRLISIFTKNKNLKGHIENKGSLFPCETHSKDGFLGKKWVTVKDVIGELPSLDASSPETASCEKIPYHRVPLLDEEKYFWVSNTPPEKSAFDNQCVNPDCGFDKNQIHSAKKDAKGINRSSRETPIRCQRCGELLPRPWVRMNDTYRLMKGYTSAYKRMSWDAPASTLTRNFSYACSDNKLHPEQNRVLSLYEAMMLHTVVGYPFDWKRQDGKKISDKLIRELIGESVPPLGLDAIFSHLRLLAHNEDTSRLSQKAEGQQELCLTMV
ncbi:DNA cytosine methyltransferase [Corticimicrobacter populi]|uniref:DNA (cytosine-5-)-methyltransferase n=1 Tax=Corticimicrobacter populi TaxID=2175229 RepID=A0A2V1JTC6_9BURK|nr:DNA cytosine methyltransferase [Corticimicrobacter populi]PWF20872.1 DNA cytosine methyltransferase [Corticimicrobacter populi]